MLSEKIRKNYLFGISIVMSVFVIIAINVMAGKNNYGMEGDEVFSYISSNSMGGFKKICFLEDQTWYEAEYFEQALTPTGNERFNIVMVSDNQAMDTHPPLYYIFLNFICSVFSGSFSEWYGIGLNIFFMILVETGLFLLMNRYLKNKYLSLFFSTIFCCSYLAVNMVLFIRMYVMLMAFILFQSWFHVRLFDHVASVDEYLIKKHWKEYICLSVITILGALTHYYFLIYQCLIAMLFVFFLWLKKKNKDIIRYIGVMAGSGMIYICLYPAVLNHIFFKYRGREAVHKFLKEGTLFGAVKAMFDSFNRQLFKGWLIPIVVVLIIATAILFYWKKINMGMLGKGILLIMPSLVYFFGVSKASPFVTIRYVSPVASIIYSAVIIWAYYLLKKMSIKSFTKNIISIAACTILFMSVFYFLDQPVKEAYFTERKEIVEEIAKDTEYCAYITGDEYNWKMWEDYINYPQFKGLFFIDGQEKKAITDTKLQQQSSLLFYVDKALELEEILTYLKENLSFKQYEMKYETNYTYILMGSNRHLL